MRTFLDLTATVSSLAVLLLACKSSSDIPLPQVLSGIRVTPSELHRELSKSAKAANAKYRGTTLCVDAMVKDNVRAPCFEIVDIKKPGVQLPTNFVAACMASGEASYQAWNEVHLICDTPADYDMQANPLTVKGCRDNWAQVAPCERARGIR